MARYNTSRLLWELLPTVYFTTLLHCKHIFQSAYIETQCVNILYILSIHLFLRLTGLLSLKDVIAIAIGGSMLIIIIILAATIHNLRSRVHHQHRTADLMGQHNTGQVQENSVHCRHSGNVEHEGHNKDEGCGDDDDENNSLLPGSSSQ